MAGTYQAGAGDPIRDDHQYRGLSAVRTAQQGYRQVYNFVAGRNDGFAHRVTTGVDDLYPDARLLLAAPGEAEASIYRGEKATRLHRLLVSGRTLGFGAS